MLRSFLSVVSGGVSFMVALLPTAWLMARLFPGVGPGAHIYLEVEDVLWVMGVASLPAVFGGYVAASLARRHALAHALALDAVLLGPFALVAPPWEMLRRYYETDILDLPPVAIAILAVLPGVALGGYLRLAVSERRRSHAALDPPAARWWIPLAGLALCVYMVVAAIALLPRPGPGERAAWLLLIVLVGLTSAGPSMWLQTALFTNTSGLATLPLTISLLFRTRSGMLQAAASGCLLLVAGWSEWRSQPLFPYVLPFALVLAAGSVILVLRPPVALLLTSSGGGRLLVDLVARGFFPYRTIALLDKGLVGPTMFFMNDIDNLRTTGSSDWKDLVRRLLDGVPFMVVDSRFATEPMQWENSVVLDRERVGRAVFVVGRNGEAPALEANADRMADLDIRKVREDELQAALEGLVRGRAT